MLRRDKKRKDLTPDESLWIQWISQSTIKRIKRTLHMNVKEKQSDELEEGEEEREEENQKCSIPPLCSWSKQNDSQKMRKESDHNSSWN